MSDRRLPIGAALGLALGFAACAPAQPAGSAPPVLTSAPAARAAAAPTPTSSAAGSTGASVTQAPRPFRFASQAPATDAGVFVAMDLGYLAEQGLDIEYVNFASGSDIVPALATRQVEGGGIAVNAATINAVARGIEIKVVADKGSLPPGFGWEAFLVRKDLWDSGRFRNASDLKDLAFGTTPPINAGAGFPALDRVLTQAGLTQNDLRVEAISFADLNTALAGGALDVAIQLEPLVQAAVTQNIAVRWKGLDEIYPNQQIGVIGYGPSVTVDEPTLGWAFATAYLKGVQYYNRALTTGADKDVVVASIARHSTVKDPRVVEAMVPVGLRADGRVNVDSLVEDQRFYVERGTVPTPIDMTQVVDQTYIDAALAQLGR